MSTQSSYTLKLIIALVWVVASSQSWAQSPTSFQTPKLAIEAFFAAVEAKDEKTVFAILGEDTREWVLSGDEVQDEAGRQRFVEAYKSKNVIEMPEPDKAILVVGQDEFPFPFPLVRDDTGWSFHAEFGKQEILDRRIGRNELNTIEVLRAIVDAQREYATVDRNNNGILEYAKNFASSDGKKDGLYWPSEEGEPLSPLGPLVAEAVRKGYQASNSSSEETSVPYFGYHYRILKSQGPSATGGKFDYIVDGKMIGGFAVIAYPTKYGVSGFKTFVVNHDGIVFETDFGEDTLDVVQNIAIFNPDEDYQKLGN